MSDARNEDYVRQLEDAVLALWGELPVEQVRSLRDEVPRLVDFCAHLHHGIEHEQAMVRQNVWAQPEAHSAQDRGDR